MPSYKTALSERKSGKVKSFKADKGFGFLKIDEGDMFFHVSDITDGSTPNVDAVYYFDPSKREDGRPIALRLSQSPIPPITDLYDWAFVPFEKALPELAKLALDEDWRYREKENEAFDEYGVIRNYLQFTFKRLAYEHKVHEKDSLAVFNTGLVDNFYEPIFALFEPNKNPNKQPWYWRSFCVKGQGREGKFLGRNFSDFPTPAQYFEGIDDIYFDATAPFDEDVEHIILDGIRNDRYPHLFLDEYAGGFDESEYSRSPNEYLRSVAERVEKDIELFRKTRDRLSTAIKLARRRAQWNYRAVVPQYYPKHNKMSLLLPLSLLNDLRIDAALVVQSERVDGQLHYQGHTIFPLAYAYRNARLVAKPISDWLNQEKILGI